MFGGALRSLGVFLVSLEAFETCYSSLDLCVLGDLTRTKLKSLFYAKIKQLTTLKVLVKVFFVYSST